MSEFPHTRESLLAILDVLKEIRDEIHYNTGALDEIRKELIHLSARQSV